MRPAVVLSMLLMVAAGACREREGGEEPVAAVLRIATWNIEDLRTAELEDPSATRPRAAAQVIQRLRPDLLLVNEMSFDQPGAPGWQQGGEPGRNGQRFADRFLAVPQEAGLEPLRYRAFMAAVNTGEASGFDLDNDGRSGGAAPALPAHDGEGPPPRATAEGRSWGNDAWGFGTFAGQYGMALLVRDDLEIVVDEVRTFRLLPWSALPGALEPVDAATGERWYTPEEWRRFRLSSKSHWDVPVRLPNGAILRLLASHPTPPAFDGPEERNRKRNHDEIRFWAEYLDGAGWIEDDQGRVGGLAKGAHFVILGDLNADPDEGSAIDDPVGRWLLQHPRVASGFTPVADAEGAAAFPELDPDDTARWGYRVDYVIPSAGLEVLFGGVWRPTRPEAVEISDHFPVWLDVAIPAE